MPATSSMLCVLFQSAAILFVALGIPLLRRLRESSNYQSSSMQADAAAWHTVNIATGRDLIAIGATLAPLTLVLWLISTRPEVYALAGAGWLAVGATGILLHVITLMARCRRR